jgi:hypothetical protein
MTPEPNCLGSARSSAEWNDVIRTFWSRLAGRLPTSEERAEYEMLLAEWAAAVRAETRVSEAA